MNLEQGIFLGVVQGITEFLPVSSSGHLTLLQLFLGTDSPPLTFEVIVHLGTLLAVLIYFRYQLKVFFATKLSHLIIATIPVVISGLLVFLFAQSIFSNPFFTGLALLGTSLLLLLSSQVTTPGVDSKHLNKYHSWVIGLFQALAIIPGLSRSGATIAAGRLTGLSKSTAFTFSFMISIPATLGATILTAKDIGNLEAAILLPSLAGFVAALITGLFSLKLLNMLFKKSSLLPFGIYTFILGSITLGLVS